MKTKNTHKKLALIFIVIVCSVIHAQNHSIKPPWVNGPLPKNTFNGYFKVVKVEGKSLSDAQVQARNRLITDLATQQGVNLTMEAINEENRESTTNNDNVDYKESNKNKEISRIKKNDFEAVFVRMDEYYKTHNGDYELWVLYWLPNNKEQKIHIPTIAYKKDNGAWRSIIIPGWGQFYAKKTIKGLCFLGSEIALVGSSVYFNSRYNNYNVKAEEASSVIMKKQYRDIANKNRTYSYITAGVAVGVYIYNIVDAFTSDSGKMEYDYDKMGIKPMASMINNSDFTFGLAINF